MGVARRIAELSGAKLNALLDRVEDPREMVEYSYTAQQELLTSVRRALVAVAAGRKRAQAQAAGLDRAAARLQSQAGEALAAGEEDLARQALARRTVLLGRLQELRDHDETLRAEEERLTVAARRLQAKTEAFALRKEAIKADYTTARAQAAAASPAVSGISEEMGDTGQATRRAEDKTAQLHAHADALDELLGSPAPGEEGEAGSPPRLTAGELQAQLEELSTRAAVEKELAEMKSRLARDTGR